MREFSLVSNDYQMACNKSAQLPPRLVLRNNDCALISEVVLGVWRFGLPIAIRIYAM